MQGHDGLDDGQPQAVGFGEGAAGTVAAIEAIEHAGHRMGRDALTAVVYQDAAAAGIVLGLDADDAVGLAIAHCIDDQVVHCPSPHVAVGVAGALGLQLEAQAAFVGDALEVIGHLAQFFMQIQRAAFHGQRRMVGLRQEQDVLDDAREPLQFLHIRFEQLFIFFQAAPLSQCNLALAHEHVDGRADLVSQVAGELRQVVVAGFQPVQHGIEGERHAPQFGRHAVLLQAGGKAVRRDLGGALAHRFQRLQPAPQQQESQERGQQDGSARRTGNAPAVAVHHAAFLHHHIGGHDLHAVAACTTLAYVGQCRDPAYLHAIGAEAGLQAGRTDRAAHRKRGHLGRLQVIGIALDEGRFPLTAEDAHILLIAHHAFEEGRALLHLLDVVEVVHQVAEVFHAPDQGLVGPLRQGHAGRAIQVKT